MVPGIYTGMIASQAVVSTLSLFSATNVATSSTIAWPAGIQVGDIAVLVDRAATTSGVPPASVTPSGFTNDVDSQLTQSSGSVSQRIMISHRVLNASESGSITGMDTGGGAKILYVFRGDAPVVAVTPSVFSSQGSASPANQTIAAAGQATPLIVLGAVVASLGSVSFSTATPAFDATQTVGLATIAGYKIYNASPANHSVGAGGTGPKNLVSGYLLAK